MNSTNSTKLLEATDKVRRMVQHVGMLGGLLLITMRGYEAALQGLTTFDIAAIGLGILFVGVGVTTKQRWNVDYIGHQIRFENSPIFAEKLFIDDELVARGGLGYRLELRGTIKTGEAKGDQILSVSKAGLFQFRCWITAEPGAQA